MIIGSIKAALWRHSLLFIQGTDVFLAVMVMTILPVVMVE